MPDDIRIKLGLDTKDFASQLDRFGRDKMREFANNVEASNQAASGSWSSMFGRLKTSLSGVKNEFEGVYRKFSESLGPVGKLGLVGAVAAGVWRGWNAAIDRAIEKHDEFIASGDKGLAHAAEAAQGWKENWDKLADGFADFGVRSIGWVDTAVTKTMEFLRIIDKIPEGLDSKGMNAQDRAIEARNKVLFEKMQLEAQANKIADDTAKKNRTATQAYDDEARTLDALKAKRAALGDTVDGAKAQIEVEKQKALLAELSVKREKEFADIAAAHEAKAKEFIDINQAFDALRSQKQREQLSTEENLLELRKQGLKLSEEYKNGNLNAGKKALEVAQQIAQLEKQAADEKKQADEKAVEEAKKAAEEAKQAAAERLAAIKKEAEAEADKRKAAIDAQLGKMNDKLGSAKSVSQVIRQLSPETQKAIEDGRIDLSSIKRNEGETRAQALARVAQEANTRKADEAKRRIDTQLGAINETPEERETRLSARDQARSALGLRGDAKAEAKDDAEYQAARRGVDKALGASPSARRAGALSPTAQRAEAASDAASGAAKGSAAASEKAQTDYAKTTAEAVKSINETLSALGVALGKK